MNKTVEVQLLSASKEYMVDRIFQSMEFKGENNTEGIHGDGKAGGTEIRPGAGAGAQERWLDWMQSLKVKSHTS